MRTADRGTGPVSRCLLVGASGRVGRLVLAAWAHQPPAGMEVIRQSRRDDGKASPGVLHWAPLDGSRPLLRFVESAGKVDSMLVLAGVPPRPGADLSANLTIAQACMHAAVQSGIPRVLLASSSAVYGAGRSGAFRESDVLAPNTPYGRAKVMMENACTPFREQGLEVCCLRIGNVLGADSLMLNVASARPGQPIRLDRFPDGAGPRRSYIGPMTMASVFASLAAFSEPLPAALNIAAPIPVTIESLLRAARVPWTFVDAPPGALQNVTLDCSCLESICPMAEDASHPASMVTQWQALSGR